MAQRGRKPAGLGVVVDVKFQRPDPPDELTDEQAGVWRATVDAMRADWFTCETHPLLILYCRHVTLARLVATVLNETEVKNDIERFNKLSAMHCRETSMIVMLATKLRLT